MLVTTISILPSYSVWAGLYPHLMTPAWWVESICTVLESMHTMRLLNILHGELHNPHSYVIVSGALRLINFGIKVDHPQEKKKISFAQAASSSSTDIDTLGRWDLHHLLYFLIQKANTDKLFTNDPLWGHFKTCFHSFTIAQLRKHPFLLNGLDRYKYCRDIMDTVRNQMSGNIAHFQELLNKEGAAFSFWDPTGDAVFNNIFYSKRRPLLEDRTAFELFCFMGNVLDHYEEKASEEQTTVANRDEGITKFLNMYPLFLAVLHFVLVAIPNNFPITEFDLGRRSIPKKTIEEEED